MKAALGHQRHRPFVFLLQGLMLLWPACCGARSAEAKMAPRESGPNVLVQSISLPPQIARDKWKDCEFNSQVIGCIDEHFSDGLRITWKDGLKMNYRSAEKFQPGSNVILIDQLGGRWRREVMVQGNVILTNVSNGNRIMVPLRLTCRPPLKGYVGYCSYD